MDVSKYTEIEPDIMIGKPELSARRITYSLATIKQHKEEQCFIPCWAPVNSTALIH